MRKKELRELIYNKFNGLCAYTGKPLGDDWQVDHIIPKSSYVWYQDQEIRSKWGITIDNVNHIDNLVPTIKIVNHYKRGFDLEGFRKYMMLFHIRLSKLPKNPKIQKTIKRKEYMMTLSNLFEITPEKPFCGKFFMEKTNIKINSYYGGPRK